MITIALILISSCIFIPQIIFLYLKKKKQTNKRNSIQLPQAEAGTTKHLFKRKTKLLSLVDVNIDNLSLNPEFEYFVVKNNCMQAKGISDGDLVGIKIFENESEKISSTKEGDLLLIYLNDKNFKGYKIRERGELTNDLSSYHTYYYENDIKKESSKTHSLESVKGIVSEIYQKEYVVEIKYQNSNY